ncbi:MAG: penicillin-binding transpeptidase domain-containing protein [Firmicutes bacterium]|nr:penicillin-binding transpeptidase domain-containing protein [Bacillota bacterium]
MRKLERRATICLALAAVLFMGIVVFGWRFVTNGGEWASFYGNTQIYTNGQINRGTIYDRNGTMLLNCTKSGIEYPQDSTLRKATLHAVGDPAGNVATGAINVYKSELIGYDLINGTYNTTAEGKNIYLSIDAEANRVAYNALNGREGTVGVFNYKTGEIMCMVSTPTTDPAYPSSTSPESAVYFNTFLMGALTPGSTLKLVTAAAAYDTLDDIENFSFTCDGTNRYEGEKIPCTGVHGTVNFETSLAKSCNGAFGSLTRQIGPGQMMNYAEKAGLTDSIDVDGIHTAKGQFTFPDDSPINLSWAGIGQYQDLVNPCAMMVYVGSIANEGQAVQPTLLKNSNFLKNLTGGKSLGRYLAKTTADKLKEMMKYDVQMTYGESNFPGLDLYAKSGTAEVGTSASNSWFVGFIDNPSHPYAFVVWIKGGGIGYQAAGPVARSVLNTLIANN